jgi:hypothetical protein
MECDTKGWPVTYLSCHIALIDSGDAWRAEYGSIPCFPVCKFEEISGSHTCPANSGWNVQTEAAICSLFGFAPTEPHGFFTAAEGTDYYALAILREKDSFGCGRLFSS